MGSDRFSRRTVLRGIGAAAAAGAVGSTGAGAASSGTGFARAPSPTEKAVRAVAMTEEGPYAAAGSGDIVARRVGGWKQGYEKILDAGLTTQSKNFYAAAASADGRNFWVAGESGVVGQYDVVDEQFTDYSQPNGATPTWHAMAVTGDAGAETVYLANGSGEVVRGTKHGKAMEWEAPRAVSGGNTIHGMVRQADGDGWVCDANGEVHQTVDGGETWTRIGVDAANVSLYGIAAADDGGLTAVGGAGYIYDYDGSTWTEHRPGQNAIRGVERTSDERIAVGGSGVVYTHGNDGWVATDADTAKTLHDALVDTTGEYPDTIVGNSGRLLERGSFDDYPDTLRVEADEGVSVDYAFDTTARARRAASADAGDSVTETSSGAHVSGSVAGGDADAFEYGGDTANFTVTAGSAADVTTSVSGTAVSVERLASRSWTSVDTPVSLTLQSVVESSAGVYAVGDSGRLLDRNGGDWTVVDEDGPNGGGNTLYGAGTTDEGDVLWYGGGSGALGRRDVTTGTTENHTAPGGYTSTWRDVDTAGPAGSERVYAVDGSGQFLRGERENGRMTWSEPIKPGNGSTIYAVTFDTPDVGYVVDGNGEVHETTDGGATWESIGIPGAGVTLYDVDARSRDDITVVGGSGKLFRYNGAVWTTTKTGGNSRYAVDREQDRGVAVGGGAQVYEREVDGWEETVNDSSDVTLYSTLATTDPDLPKVAVGGSGVVLEQSFDDPLF